MSSVWRVDGREVYATRNGNGGPVPNFQHRFKTTLAAGRHLICLRGAGAAHDLKIHLPVLRWRADFDEEVRSDRAAGWRDYCRSIVRIEERPRATGAIHGVPTEIFEAALAAPGRPDGQVACGVVKSSVCGDDSIVRCGRKRRRDMIAIGQLENRSQGSL